MLLKFQGRVGPVNSVLRFLSVPICLGVLSYRRLVSYDFVSSGDLLIFHVPCGTEAHPVHFDAGVGPDALCVPYNSVLPT